jgi:hypothetical protein
MSPKETGIIIVSIGMVVFLAGMLLLMDKALMIAGNLLIIIGFLFLVRSKVFSLLKPQLLQGTVVFGLGVLFLFYNFALFGFLLEVAGLALIFKDSIPTFRSVLTKVLFGGMLKRSK